MLHVHLKLACARAHTMSIPNNTDHLNYLQWMCESSVSMEMYPDEPEPPPTGVKGAATPKGAKLDESAQGGLLENGDNLEASEKETLDAFVSVKKYVVRALKGLSPKNQVEVDEALMQLNNTPGTHSIT